MNYEELKKWIKERGYLRNFIADKLGISKATLSYKITGLRPFTISEVAAFTKRLGMSVEDRDRIFFANDEE